MSATEQACHAGNFKTISATISHSIGVIAAKNKLSKALHPLYRKNINRNGTLKIFNVPKLPDYFITLMYDIFKLDLSSYAQCKNIFG